MDEKTKAAILLGVLIPSAVVLVILLLVCIIRRIHHWRLYGQRGYNQVNHELDEEEIEFKRILEKRSDYDDYEELLSKDTHKNRSGGGGGKPGDEEEGLEEDFEDFEFSAKEKDRLSVLEKFRSNLVAEADQARPATATTNAPPLPPPPPTSNKTTLAPQPTTQPQETQKQQPPQPTQPQPQSQPPQPPNQSSDTNPNPTVKPTTLPRAIPPPPPANTPPPQTSNAPKKEIPAKKNEDDEDIDIHDQIPDFKISSEELNKFYDSESEEES